MTHSIWTRTKQTITIFIGFAGFALNAHAGTISAELSATEVEIGSPLEMAVSVTGSRDGDVVVPDVDGLVIRQTGTRQSMIFDNGKRVVEYAANFTIYPQQTGEFTIPSLKVEVDGKEEATLPLTFKVLAAGGTPSAQAPSANQPPGQGQGQSPQGQQQPGVGGKAPKGVADTSGVFIERECTTTTPYTGEAVACAIRIYHPGNLNGGQRLSQSSADFRRFPLEGEKRYARMVGNKRYTVIELKEIVVPERGGNLELPPYSLDARVLTWNKRGNPMDKFFDQLGGGVFNFDFNFTEEKQVKILSEPTPMVVKPLPDAGKPADFSGLVGNFHLTGEVSRTTLAAGETVTITIRLSGTGLADRAPDPLPAGIKQLGKVYADKPEYQEEAGEQGIRSSRTYKYALVPSKEGEQALPPVEINVFNPQLGQYVVLKAELPNLIVQPGQAEESKVVGTQAVPSSQSDVKQLSDELPLLHRESVTTKSQTITKSFVIKLGTVSLFSWLSYALLFFYTGRFNKRDAAAVLRQQAWRQFKATMQPHKAAPSAAAAEQGFRAFREYVGHKLGIAGTSLSGAELLKRLNEKTAWHSLRDSLEPGIKRLEAVEYGGAPMDQQAADAWLTALMTAAEEFERTC